jgi:outer membrane receptor for ferrienterochelin and colicins
MATMVGRVEDQGSPIPFAQVSVKGSNRVLETDAQGRFLLQGIAPGTHVLLVTAMGYETLEQPFEARAGESTFLEFDLRPTAFEMNPIVVTGTMRETFVSESPVKVDVVNVRFLQRNITNNLMEALQTVNGLYAQVDCGVCYPNNIRINGMEGPYTAILIDGMPIMSALASVYGLNGLNPAVIERLEIIKGPSSTLYGSEAMAGVVNVITKDPRFTPRYSLDFRAHSTGQRVLDFSASPGRPGLRGFLSGSVQQMNQFLDENGDGFSDLPKANTAALFGKLSWRPEGEEVLSLAGKYYYEDRFGGVRSWTPDLRGSDEVYGESVFTNRLELVGSLRPRNLEDWKLDFSYAWHDQDAMYGDEAYVGDFHTLFGNLTRKGTWREKHALLLGATARYLVQDDNTVATVERDVQFIPGVFVQNEYTPSWRWGILGGMRLDHHERHGVIASPRLSVRWQPARDGKTTLRLNTGTGFRVVSVFSEDFAAIAHGSRRVVMGEELDPERSWSVTGNFNQVLDFGGNPMMVDVDLFHTRFSNQIIPDYDVDPREIVFRNLHGHAVSRGVSLSFNQNFSNLPFLYQVGVTFQDVYTMEDGRKESITFSPDFTGGFTFSYSAPRGVTVDYTGTVVGPMSLPQYDPPFQRKERSPVHSIHNLQAGLGLGGGRQLYAAVKNLFDWTQESPLVDPGNPFGDHFDTAYVYGPIYGRQLLLGFRVAGGR